MPRINDKDDQQNEQQSVQDRNWQDGSENNNPNSNNELPPTPNEDPTSKENIPKLTEEEQNAQENWRNSPEMQQGLQEMLPKEEQNPISEHQNLNLDQIRQESSGNDKGNPLQMLIMNFYKNIQTMSEGDLQKEIESGFASFSKNKTPIKDGVNDTAKVSNLSKGTTAFASGVDTANKAAKTSKGVTGSVAGGITALKDGVQAIQHIYEAYKDATTGAGNTSEDKMVASLQIVKELISSAHGTITTLKAILELFQQGTGGLAVAIPGLGIALNAVTIAIDVYDLMKAKTSEAFIQKQLKENKWEESLGKKKKHWWSKKKTVKAKDKRKAQDEYIATFEGEIARMAHEQMVLLSKKTEYETKGEPDKAKETEQKIQEKNSMLRLAMSELASLKENQALTNLSEINKDRMKNAGFHIGTQLTSLVGNVLALVPEPNTQLAGVALRSVAAGAVLFKKVGGVIVQKMRDHADKNPESSMNKFVDSTRSTDREMARKKESARYIFKQIATSDLSDGRSVNTLNNYIDATGTTPRKVGQAHESGGVPKAVQLLVQAQGKT